METIAKTTVEFLENCTMHGLRHIVVEGDGGKRARGSICPTRSHLGGSFWFLTCAVALAMWVVMSLLIWNRFNSSPTVVTIQSMNAPIWNITFPAVTLCNVNKVYGPNTINITEKLLSRGLERKKIRKFFSDLTALIHHDTVHQDSIDVYEELEKLDYTVDKLMLELAQPCENMLKTCYWLDEKHPCEELFSVTKSVEGYCCSFNYNALYTNLNVDNKRRDYAEENITGAGPSMGLKVIADAEPHNYVSSIKGFAAIQALIHDTRVYPETSSSLVFMQPNQEVVIIVQPTILSSAPEVKLMPQDQRRCWYTVERHSRLSYKYQFDNCITECRVDAIFQLCECIPFYYPDIDNDGEDRRLCDLRDSNCLKANARVIYGLQLQSINPESDDSNNVGIKCACRQACSQRSYKISVDKGIRQELIPVPIQLSDDKNVTNLLQFNIYFKDLAFVKYRRDPYMTWDSLLASFGGIFGLCLGGSVISLAELVYYYTLRLRYHWLHRASNYGSVYPSKGRSTNVAKDNKYTRQKAPILQLGSNRFGKEQLVLSRRNVAGRQFYSRHCKADDVPDNVFLNRAALRDLMMYKAQKY